MKNKITRTLTAFCAALLLMGGFSVTAFAQTPEETPDATDDSGVVYEEPQEAEPLTPEGNATLVDDFGGNKQLITVTTKAGNYFYILIDRDDEGENTVHFLNQVDDAAFYYFKVLKPKKDAAKGSDDLSDYDFDDYDEDEETEEEQPGKADDGEETDEEQEDKEV